MPSVRLGAAAAVLPGGSTSAGLHGHRRCAPTYVGHYPGMPEEDEADGDPVHIKAGVRRDPCRSAVPDDPRATTAAGRGHRRAQASKGREVRRPDRQEAAGDGRALPQAPQERAGAPGPGASRARRRPRDPPPHRREEEVPRDAGAGGEEGSGGRALRADGTPRAPEGARHRQGHGAGRQPGAPARRERRAGPLAGASLLPAGEARLLPESRSVEAA
jgi:hypothetical protein